MSEAQAAYLIQLIEVLTIKLSELIVVLDNKS